MRHRIGPVEIDLAIQDLDQYVKDHMRTRSNPQMHLADLGEQDLINYQVPFISVKGEMQWKAKDLIAISKIVPDATIVSDHNADKTVITYYVRFPIEFPANAIPPRYKNARSTRNEGPPSISISVAMIATGLAGLYWTFQMKSILL
jgi:hypothetical protein